MEIPALVALRARVKRLVHIGDQVNDPLQRLQAILWNVSRLQLPDLCLKGADNALPTWAIADFAVAAVGFLPETHVVPGSGRRRAHLVRPRRDRGERGARLQFE